MDKRGKKSLLLEVFIFGILLISFSLGVVSAEASVCCEKTLSGAWCQNTIESQCDGNYESSPTSCDSTSYCKRGCCYDSSEGLCMESTSQRVCNANNGTWNSNAECNIPQCSLGCCILGDQGAFVTLTRCKALSGYYGLKTNFKTDITDEISCIAAAQSADAGACVFENDQGLLDCKFTTRVKCPTASLGSLALTNKTGDLKVNASTGFYKDTLCTSEELGTICGRDLENTMVIAGKEGIYFKDTCDNPGNIYDYSKRDDDAYWSKVVKPSESCGAKTGSKNSKTCGNCDYYYGSTAKRYDLAIGKPNIGNYICKSLDCNSQNKKHGESWCLTDTPTGEGLDPVGSRYYKAICMDNEVLVEACDDFRGQVCIEDTFDGFNEAACRVNRWQSCVSQVEEGDCVNFNQRDCIWKSGYYFSENTGQIEKSNNDTNKGALSPDGLCLPRYPPGLVFWSDAASTTTQSQGILKSKSNFSASTPSFGSGTSGFNAQTPNFGTGYVNPAGDSSISPAGSQCSLGNAKLNVRWTKVKRMWPFNDEAWKCDQETGNCQYVSDEVQEISDEQAKKWAEEMNQFCVALGDCGGYINWQNQYTEEGYAAYNGQERVAGSGGAKILEAEPKTAVTNSGTGTTGSGTNGGTGLGGIMGALIKSWASEN